MSPVTIITPLWRTQNLRQLHDNILAIFDGVVDWRWVVALDLNTQPFTIADHYRRTAFCTFFGGDRWQAGRGRNLAAAQHARPGWIINHDDDCLFLEPMREILLDLERIEDRQQYVLQWKREGDVGMVDRGDTNSFMYDSRYCHVSWSTEHNADCEVFQKLVEEHGVTYRPEIAVHWNCLR